jgi:hypothetical protein
MYGASHGNTYVGQAAGGSMVVLTTCQRSHLILELCKRVLLGEAVPVTDLSMSHTGTGHLDGMAQGLASLGCNEEGGVRGEGR